MEKVARVPQAALKKVEILTFMCAWKSRRAYHRKTMVLLSKRLVSAVVKLQSTNVSWKHFLEDNCKMLWLDNSVFFFPFSFTSSLCHLTSQRPGRQQSQRFYLASAATAVGRNVMNMPGLIGTSKSCIFQHFRKSVREKQASVSGQVLLWCLHLMWTHTSDSCWRPWEFTTWRKWFTRPNPPSCLIPWGAGAEAGAMLGYQSVFLPFCLLLFFPFLSLLDLGRPFCNLQPS